MFKICHLLLILCVVLLTGCKQPNFIPNISAQVRTKILSQMDNWQADGRAAIRSKDQGHNVAMEWQQIGQNYDLYFYGPLSSGSARIIGKPGHVKLTTSDGNTYEADAPENLVYEHLGWNLPFAGLEYWIKGLPSPNSDPTIKIVDQYNQLQLLEQDGWKIEYQSYRFYDNITLPERINLSKHDLKLKLIIQNWKNNKPHD